MKAQVALLAWLAVAAVAAPARAAEPAAADVLTLSAAFAGATAHHPLLQATRADVDAARERAEMARLGYLPTGTLDVSHTETTANFAPRPGSIPANVVFKPKTNPDLYAYWAGIVSSRWNAWDFGRTMSVVAVADHLAQAAQADSATVRDQLWLHVAQAYLVALAAEANLASLTEARQTVARQRDMAQSKVSAGIRPKLDLAKAESDLAAAEVAVLRADESVRAARVALGILMGARHAPRQALLAPEVDAAELHAVDLDSDERLDALVADAAGRRPEYAAVALRLASIQAEIDAARKALMPTVYLSAQATLAGVDLSTLVYNYGVTGGVSVPVAALWTQSPAIAEARARLRSLTAQRDAQLLGLRSEVDQARTALLQARKRLPAVLTLVGFAVTAQEQAQQRYAAGIGTLIEASDAASALTQARIQQVQANLDVAVASAQLVRALGRVPR